MAPVDQDAVGSPHPGNPHAVDRSINHKRLAHRKLQNRKIAQLDARHLGVTKLQLSFISELTVLKTHIPFDLVSQTSGLMICPPIWDNEEELEP